MDFKTSPRLSSRRKDSEQRKCDRREKLHQNKTSGHPIIHADGEHAQKGGDKRLFRLCEDSRPMFSPVPGNTSDAEGEDSPRVTAGSNKRCKEKLTFPSIHVERCEKARPSYSPSLSPSLSPRHATHTVRDGHSQARSVSPGSGGLNVPSPYLPCTSEGRLLLMTEDSNRGLLSSWSRSEGNLPEAVRRSSSSPGSQNHLLDITYRPSWQTGSTLRPSSDVSLHELRRQQHQQQQQQHQQHSQGRRSCTPTRVPVRLEPLNPALGSTHRAVSATSLQSPSP